MGGGEGAMREGEAGSPAGSEGMKLQKSAITK